MALSMFKSLLFFVGTPDVYVIFAIATLILSTIVVLRIYSKMSENEKEDVRDQNGGNIFALLLMSVLWPVTYMFCIIVYGERLFLSIADGDFNVWQKIISLKSNISNKISDYKHRKDIKNAINNEKGVVIPCTLGATNALDLE